MANCLLLIVASVWLFTLGDNAEGREGDERTAPTFYVNASGGYSVYKSTMVQSNDTSTTTGYGFGVFAGGQRELGMRVQREASTFAFALNDAAIAMSWQDTHLTWRFGGMHLGVLLSNSNWIVSAPPDADGDGLLDQDTAPEPLMDIVTSGYGANFGASIPVSKNGAALLDITYVTTSAVQQKQLTASDGSVMTEREVVLGPRTEIDFGGLIGITRNWLSATFGFKYRTYQISIDGEAYADQMNSTYLGLKSGWTF